MMLGQRDLQMNASFHFKVLAIVVITLSGQFGAPVVRAQQAVPATATQPAPVQLSADVWDVLRMAQGNVGDTTLIAYVKNSGGVYALGASEILSLKERGLSDQVITAMLDPRKNLVP